jgi:hypothetical protein
MIVLEDDKPEQMMRPVDKLFLCPERCISLEKGNGLGDIEHLFMMDLRSLLWFPSRM